MNSTMRHNFKAKFILFCTCRSRKQYMKSREKNTYDRRGLI